LISDNEDVDDEDNESNFRALRAELCFGETDDGLVTDECLFVHVYGVECLTPLPGDGELYDE
jgi:hypothetical protein